MRIGKLFGIEILLLVVINGLVAGQDSKAKSLNLVIDELATIARLTNGIALQKDLAKDRTAIHRITAEFLNLKSEDVLYDLKNLQIGNVIENLKKVYKIFDDIPEASLNFTEILEAFSSIKTMQHSRITKQNIVDPSGELEQAVGRAKRLNRTDFLKVPAFKIIANELEWVRSYSKLVNVDELIEHLQSMRIATIEARRQLVLFKNYEQSLYNLTRFVRVGAHFDSVALYAKSSQLFTTNYRGFTAMSAGINGVMDRIHEMSNVTDHQKNISEILKSLEPVIWITMELMKPRGSYELTSGFPEGLPSLKLLFEELKSNRYHTVTQGKSTAELESLLAILWTFNEKIQEISKEWKIHVSKDTLPKVNLVFHALQHASETADKYLKAQIGNFSDLPRCFQNLSLPTEMPDYKATNRAFRFIMNLSRSIIEFVRLFDNLYNEFYEQEKALKRLERTLGAVGVPNINVHEPIWMWQMMRMEDQYLAIINGMRKIYAGFQDFQTDNPFVLLKNYNPDDFSSMPILLKSLANTNVSEMLDCVDQTPSFILTGLEDAFNFTSTVDVMQASKPSLPLTQRFLGWISTVPLDLGNMEYRVNQARRRMDLEGQKRRRRQSVAPPKTLSRLSDSRQVAQHLGRGVRVLREYGTILKQQDSVMVAVNANKKDPLASLIPTIKHSDRVWQNPQQLGVMIDDLNKLEEWAARLQMENISMIWSLFHEANRITGAQVIAKFFKTAIAPELANSGDPKVQASARTFEQLGDLNLNFGSHHVTLHRAARTLHPIDQFLDYFFDLNSADNWAEYQEPDPEALKGPLGLEPFWQDIIIGVAVFTAIICAVGLCCFANHMKTKNKMTNRERHWIYEAFYLDGTPKNDILKAVEMKSLRSVQNLVNAGCYVDVFGPYKNPKGEIVIGTPLYQAVDKCLPKIVEALLSAGAERDIWTSEKQTTQQLLERKLRDPSCNMQRDELKQIVELFKDYYKHGYPLLARDLMPIDKFRIGWINSKTFTSTKTAVKFKSSFGFLFVKQNEYDKMTHIVLPVDNRGVLNMDKFSLREKNDTLNLAILQLVLCSPVILVKPIWMDECIKGDKNLHKDYKHRITKVLYNRKEYASVDGWKEWARRFSIPYLHNVDVAYFVPENCSQHQENGYFERIVKALGGNFVTVTNLINGAAKRTTRPYWQPKLSRHWIVHKEEYTALVDYELTKPCYAQEDLQSHFTMMPLEAFFEIMLESKGANGFDPTRKPILASQVEGEEGEEEDGDAGDEDLPAMASTRSNSMFSSLKSTQGFDKTYSSGKSSLSSGKSLK